jgi:nucleoside 2-deoxyribosyltransferase
MLIYLAGSIPKGDSESKKAVNWRKIYTKEIQKIDKTAKTIDPDVPTLEGDSLAVTGADCLLIKTCDLVVVNAETKVGAGTAMELVVAKYFKKPVVSILPKDSHHRRSNVVFNGRRVSDWIHPFIDTFSDVVIEDISEFSKANKKLQKLKIKEIGIIDQAVNYVEKLQKSTKL